MNSGHSICSDVILALFFPDVLAVVKGFGPLDEYRRDNEIKNKLKMIITDLEYCFIH